jgi:protein MpaA
VVGCIQGDECAGVAVTRRLDAAPALHNVQLWIVHHLNPDGHLRRTRGNARGVDLNRNFPAAWRAGSSGAEWGGRRPLSEPESRAIARLVRRVDPGLSVWFHQPQGLVRAWGPSVPVARRYARLADARFRALGWPPGSAPRWQNTRLSQASFVVELPRGRLGAPAARRHADALRALLSAGP